MNEGIFIQTDLDYWPLIFSPIKKNIKILNQIILKYISRYLKIQFGGI